MGGSLSAQMIAVRKAYSAIITCLIKSGLISMDQLRASFDEEEKRLLTHLANDQIKEPAKALLKDALSELAMLYPFDPGPTRPKPVLRLIESDGPG